MTLNDTQSSTETTPSEASIPSEAPTPAQEEVKRKINIENDILVSLYRKQDKMTEKRFHQEKQL